MESVPLTMGNKTRRAYEQLNPREKKAVKKFWRLQKAVSKDWQKFMDELTKPV